MAKNYFISQLEHPEFEIRVKPASDIPEAKGLGVDYVHCSGDFPAVYIKEVGAFDHDALVAIAETKHRIWNQSLVGFLYVTSPSELRIYDCNKEPFQTNGIENLDGALQDHEIERCKQGDLKRLAKLKRIFSLAAVDGGALWNVENDYQKKIDVSARIDKRLVRALAELFREIMKDKSSAVDEDVLHALIIRCLFVMYLQDREAIPQEILNKVGCGNFLESFDTGKTYSFFNQIVPHFNGHVFPIVQGGQLPDGTIKRAEQEQITARHLRLIQRALYDGDLDLEKPRLFGWRLFNFRFIRIELLSEIYEGFLKETNPSRQREQGVYYTPIALVELILRQVLPTDSTDYQVRILDPACGTGNFLVQGYQRVVKRWQKAHPSQKLSFKILRELMESSIFGVEIDPNSIRVAAFSLYLTMLNFLNPADVWLKEGEKFPNLIRDPENKIGEPGKGNLFRENTIGDHSEYQFQSYTIIVGNPPFGTKNLDAKVKKYCEKNGFPLQMSIPFLHKLAESYPTARLALVFNSSILFNTATTSENFRKWLFNDCTVEKVFNLSILRNATKKYGGKLFAAATVPISVAFYSRDSQETARATIEYWAPKTYVRSLLSENVLIDGSDIKYVPRHLCKDPTSNIWKVAQWGTLQDYYFVKTLEARDEGKFGEYLERNAPIHNVGLQPMGKAKANPKPNSNLKDLGFLDSAEIHRYYTPEAAKTDINQCIKSKEAIAYYTQFFSEKDRHKWPQIETFRGIGEDARVYLPPHVLIKEGISRNQLCASYLDYPTTFTKAVLGIAGGSENMLKAITAYLNSRLSSYYLFLTTAAWGIERDRVEPNELYDLPALPSMVDIEAISSEVDKIIQEKRKPNAREKKNHLDMPNGNADYSKDPEDEIDELILNSFEVSEKEKRLIEDLVNFSIDLFHKKEKSHALELIGSDGEFLESYSTILENTLNEEFGDDEIMVTVRPYAPSAEHSLCLVAVSFVDAGLRQKPKIYPSDDVFDALLRQLNTYSMQQHSRNLFVQKHILFRDADDFLILKPNQKRHWTNSAGMEDAYRIVGEIMSRKN